MKLSTLIEEVVAPHRDFGVAINVALSAGEVDEPVGGRNPAILYGLGNLLENAVDFARERVDVAASWSGQDVAVTITDDGPGFAPEIMDRIGEPYVTSRRQQRQSVDGEASGLGLGFFIAKTLLERSGATLSYENRAAPARGAVVRVAWVTILKFAKGLSDRQPADAVRTRIDWKYLLCLKLDDPGFHHRGLS